MLDMVTESQRYAPLTNNITCVNGGGKSENSSRFLLKSDLFTNKFWLEVAFSCFRQLTSKPEIGIGSGIKHDMTLDLLIFDQTSIEYKMKLKILFVSPGRSSLYRSEKLLRTPKLTQMKNCDNRAHHEDTRFASLADLRSYMA